MSMTLDDADAALLNEACVGMERSRGLESVAMRVSADAGPLLQSGSQRCQAGAGPRPGSS